MVKMRVTEEQRITEFLCDTKECDRKGEWLCPGGVIACDTHKPRT